MIFQVLEKLLTHETIKKNCLLLASPRERISFCVRRREKGEGKFETCSAVLYPRKYYFENSHVRIE